MSKLLITGGSGLLAMNWACFARDKHEVTLALHNTNVNLAGTSNVKLNLESKTDLIDALKSASIDVVIHAAGMTNVDLCEQSPELANHVNSKLTENLAFACHHLGIKLVHISTDHLFAGDISYSTELSNPSPLNAYAISKLNAEKQALMHCPDALIIRTNFFGWGHKQRQSFSDWIYDKCASNSQVTLFDDVYFTPILIEYVAQYVHDLLDNNQQGIFNVVSSERVSKYAFGLYLSQVFGFSERLILRDSIASVTLAAPRPKDMSLSNHKLIEMIMCEPPTLVNQLQRLKLQLENGQAEEIKNAIRES